MTTKEIFKCILAGVFISIAGMVYLRVGGMAGAVLFAFGLLAVVSWQLWLFAGRSYMVWRKGHLLLAGCLFFNLVGCLLTALAVWNPEIGSTAEGIIATRLGQGALKCGLLSIGCGIIMTTAVTRAKEQGNWWPLLFGVPVFIMCGFPHCIADAFYLFTCRPSFLMENLPAILAFYPSIVLGNYLGCNAYRLAG